MIRRIAMGLVGLGLATALPAHAAPKSDDLSGTWVMLQVTGTVSKVPVIGNIYARTTTVVVYDLEEKSRRLRGSGKLCKLKLDSGTKLVKTKLPPSFMRALPTPKLDARVTRRGGRVSIHQMPQTIIVGAKLKRPERDALPQSAKDPKAFDQDRDGNPGVTVTVSGLVSGKVYVAQRNWTSLQGSLRVDDNIHGKVRFNSEQVVLGATSSMLESTPSAKPDPKRSYFRMARLPAGASCADALRKAKELGR